MKIAIVGSRDFSDLMMVTSYVHDNFTGEDTLVSGGARGVDSVAEQQARALNVPCIIFKPDWNRYGKKAGFLRNQEIVDAADKIVAFWDGKSRGTLSTIELARAAGKPVEIYYA